MDSQIAFMSNGVRRPITAANGVWLKSASCGRPWEGLHLEVGESQGNVSNALFADGHMIAMNPSDISVQICLRDEDNMAWVPHLLRPGAFLIYPEGSPIRMRCPQPSQWSTAIITGAYLDAMSGGHLELGAAINVDDPVLRHLFWALIEEMNHPSPRELSTRSLVSSFAISLGCRLGRRAAPALVTEGLEPLQLARVKAWLSRHLSERITVADLAAEAGLSQTQFTRRFKRTIGYTPWEYIVDLRLQRARDILEFGNTVSNAALECGFSDQAHLSRLFKRRFGTPPAAFAKQRRAAGNASSDRQ